MRDPFSWSLPLGRIFGIQVRLHVLFPVIAVGLILCAAIAKDPPLPQGSVIDVTLFFGILFVCVLLHELGHCAGARLMDGDASEILIWPLGGLAAIEVPHKPRSQFIAAAAGPLMNLGLCIFTGLLFLWVTDFSVRPSWNPFWLPMRFVDGTTVHLARLFTWDGSEWMGTLWDGKDWKPWVIAFLARFFWANWILFLLNVVLVGFPMDGGRMFQCLLWPIYGFGQATVYAIYAGFFTMLAVAIFAIFTNELLPLCLALFIFFTCRQQLILLETGGEESMFGYDFSQGYTSLESHHPVTRRRKPNVWQRFLQRRAAKKLQREQDTREAEERRMDQLLEKVQREGLAALTDEERRFLKRVSDRYRNRQ